MSVKKRKQEPEEDIGHHMHVLKINLVFTCPCAGTQINVSSPKVNRKVKYEDAFSRQQSYLLLTVSHFMFHQVPSHALMLQTISQHNCTKEQLSTR